MKKRSFIHAAVLLFITGSFVLGPIPTHGNSKNELFFTTILKTHEVNDTLTFNYFKTSTINLTKDGNFKTLNLWGNDLQVGFFYHEKPYQLFQDNTSEIIPGLGAYILFRRPIGIIEITNEDGYIIKRNLLYSVWGSFVLYQALVEYEDSNDNHLLEIAPIYQNPHQNRENPQTYPDVLIKAVPFVKEKVSLSTEFENNTMIITMKMTNASYVRSSHEPNGQNKNSKVEEIRITSYLSFSFIERSDFEDIHLLNIVLDDASTNTTEIMKTGRKPPRNRIIEVKRNVQTVPANKIHFSLNQKMLIKGWDAENTSSTGKSTNLGLIQDVSFFNYLEFDNRPFLPHDPEINLRPLKLNVEINSMERNITRLNLNPSELPPDAIYNLTRPYMVMLTPWNVKYRHGWSQQYQFQNNSTTNVLTSTTRQQASRIHPTSRIPHPFMKLLNDTWFFHELKKGFHTLGLEFRQASLYEQGIDQDFFQLSHQPVQVSLNFTIPLEEDIILLSPPVVDLTKTAPILLIIVPFLGIITVLLSRITKK